LVYSLWILKVGMLAPKGWGLINQVSHNSGKKSSTS